MIALLAMLFAAGTSSQIGVFKGPGRACLKHSYVDLAKGETLKLESAGTESARFSLRTPQGRSRLIESETIGDGSYSGAAIGNDGRTRVFRNGSGRRATYLFHGRTDYSPDADRLTVVLTGLRTEGATASTSLVRRIHVAEPEPGSCQHAYRYGWDVISESLNP